MNMVKSSGCLLAFTIFLNRLRSGGRIGKQLGKQIGKMVHKSGARSEQIWQQ